jgi:predicted membrane chloride channel (bestrophin family)
LDRIGVELENPFAENHLGHLPINDISAKIERNLLGLLQDATLRQSPTLPTDRDLIYKPSA